MAPILTSGERPASAVQLMGPILVGSGRGEVEGSAGDYLVVTTAGRQVVMSEKEYRTATGEPGAVSPPPAEVVTPKPEPKRNVLGSIFKKREPVRQQTWGINRVPGFSYFVKKTAPETREPLAITSALESETSACNPEPPAGTSSPVDISETVSSPVDVQPEPEAVKCGELPPISDQIDLKCVEPEEEMSEADTPRRPSLTETDGISLLTIGPGTAPRDLPPPTPRPVYNPRADPANLVLPKQKPGVFQRFMRPGAEPEKKPATKKKPFALAFGKKAKEPEPEPIKDRWPTVQPEWI